MKGVARACKILILRMFFRLLSSVELNSERLCKFSTLSLISLESSKPCFSKLSNKFSISCKSFMIILFRLIEVVDVIDDTEFDLVLSLAKGGLMGVITNESVKFDFTESTDVDNGDAADALLLLLLLKMLLFFSEEMALWINVCNVELETFFSILK